VELVDLPRAADLVVALPLLPAVLPLVLLRLLFSRLRVAEVLD
jgi:hypothetical protein